MPSVEFERRVHAALLDAIKVTRRVGEGRVVAEEQGRASEMRARLARLSREQAEIAGKILEQIQERLKFLNDVGLDYLTLDRSAETLSGGEVAGEDVREKQAIRKEANGGKDADIKGFAGKTLPTLEEHLQHARQARQAATTTAAGSTKNGRRPMTIPTFATSALTRFAMDWNVGLELSVSSSNWAFTPFFVHGVCEQSQPPAFSSAFALAGS